MNKQEDIDTLYDQWAGSYDHELMEMGYQSPIRCALALANFVPLEIPVLDFGCGTGLSGEALKKVGFKHIFGTEINSNMREIAKRKNIYEEFYVTDTVRPFPATAKFYGICAVGVISAGAGPPSLLRQSLNCLKKDGIMCFSYNDHTLSNPSYMDALKQVKELGEFEEVFSEYGEHLTKEGLGSTVYVFKSRRK